MNATVYIWFKQKQSGLNLRDKLNFFGWKHAFFWTRENNRPEQPKRDQKGKTILAAADALIHQ